MVFLLAFCLHQYQVVLLVEVMSNQGAFTTKNLLGDFVAAFLSMSTVKWSLLGNMLGKCVCVCVCVCLFPLSVKASSDLGKKKMQCQRSGQQCYAEEIFM